MVADRKGVDIRSQRHVDEAKWRVPSRGHQELPREECCHLPNPRGCALFRICWVFLLTLGHPRYCTPPRPRPPPRAHGSPFPPTSSTHEPARTERQTHKILQRSRRSDASYEITLSCRLLRSEDVTWGTRHQRGRPRILLLERSSFS